MDIRFTKFGDKIRLGKDPTPTAPVYSGNNFIINALHNNLANIFSVKSNTFTEISTAAAGLPYRIQAIAHKPIPDCDPTP
ncbi:hypothetical protein [Sulfuriflexus sp.]|uniref:hypothetical protein n=1 Tax=Sulfuriflexus sp. TaxID=2015443 RepID=UPI0028CF02A8|nr:hypothetical protein [Sulfuriflexus sp.]MDT8403008.1 hypothetical protein [Sulfuriflexus sp.]